MLVLVAKSLGSSAVMQISVLMNSLLGGNSLVLLAHVVEFKRASSIVCKNALICALSSAANVPFNVASRIPFRAALISVGFVPLLQTTCQLA